VNKSERGSKRYSAGGDRGLSRTDVEWALQEIDIKTNV
jgi:hypothetical protein